jgi:hypothetical protein
MEEEVHGRAEEEEEEMEEEDGSAFVSSDWNDDHQQSAAEAIYRRAESKDDDDDDDPDAGRDRTTMTRMHGSSSHRTRREGRLFESNAAPVLSAYQGTMDDEALQKATIESTFSAVVGSIASWSSRGARPTSRRQQQQEQGSSHRNCSSLLASLEGISQERPHDIIDGVMDDSVDEPPILAEAAQVSSVPFVAGGGRASKKRTNDAGLGSRAGGTDTSSVGDKRSHTLPIPLHKTTATNLHERSAPAIDGSTPKFPQILHRMLMTLEREESVVARFRPHGRAFTIHDPTAFVQDVMPHWFRQSKFVSFRRQLHLYNFRLIKGRRHVDAGSFWVRLLDARRPSMLVRCELTLSSYRSRGTPPPSSASIVSQGTRGFDEWNTEDTNQGHVTTHERGSARVSHDETRHLNAALTN